MSSTDWDDETTPATVAARLVRVEGVPEHDVEIIQLPRAVVFSPGLERRAAWCEALHRRGLMPTPTGVPLDTVIELIGAHVHLLVIDCARGPFRLDAVGLARLALEESLADEVIVDRRTRAALPVGLQIDPRVRAITAAEGDDVSVPRRKRVLLAEDDPTLRRRVSQRLREHGFNVTEVGDGDALARAVASEASDIDLVVTDVRMPRRPGTSALAALPVVAPDVPVVIMTAYPDDDVMRSAEALATCAVLEKPFALDELVTVIDGLHA